MFAASNIKDKNMRLNKSVVFESVSEFYRSSYIKFSTMIMKFLLSAFFLTLISISFNPSVLSLFGIYALHLWCVDNFESIINIFIYFLRKLLSPCECRSLKNRFGDWAGKWVNSFQLKHLKLKSNVKLLTNKW